MAIGDSNVVEVDIDFVVNLVVADGGVVIIDVHMHEAGEKTYFFLLSLLLHIPYKSKQSLGQYESTLKSLIRILLNMSLGIRLRFFPSLTMDFFILFNRDRIIGGNIFLINENSGLIT